MSMTLKEELNRLEALRRAMGWSEAEFQRRSALIKAKHETKKGASRTDAASGGRSGDASYRTLGTRLPPDDELIAAPWRFVEVVDAVALPPESVRKALAQQPATLLSQPLPDGYCGEIEVTFAAETPLLIGAEGKTREGDAAVVPLAAGSDWWIPGATIRGMLRSAAEIVGYGRLEQANRHHVYGLRDFEHPYYNDPRGEYGGSPVARASAVRGGWLHYDQNTDQYKIEPSELAYVGIDELLDAGYLGERYRDAADWVELTLEQKYDQAGMGRRPRIDFAKGVRRFRDAPPDSQGRRRVRPDVNGSITGTLVFSNQVPRGKRDPLRQKKVEYVLLTRPGSGDRHVLNRDPGGPWDRFEMVHTRPGRNAREPDGSWRVLQPIVTGGQPIPVFYVGDPSPAGQDKPDFAFGLTRLFKIPHRNRLGDMLDRMPAHKLVTKPGADYSPDLVSALFGFVQEARDLGRGSDDSRRDTMLKGRIAFSGARITDGAATAEGTVETVMGTPRASFAPFYLAGPVKDWSSEDNSTGIAGRKRYMPRFPASDLRQARGAIEKRLRHQLAALTDGARANEKTRTRLQFLVPAKGKSEFRFTSRIRLHNVTAAEIGLVLAALTHFGDEEKHFRHQLGHAKPFGAGQARLVSARLAVTANVKANAESTQRVQAPATEELPGDGREGICPAPADGRLSLSHLPFLHAFIDHMQRMDNYTGGTRDLVCKAFPDTASVRGFLGSCSPDEGKKMPQPGEDTYLRLRITHPKTRKQVNPYNELRRATKLPRPGDRAPDPNAKWRRLLPAPERPFLKR